MESTASYTFTVRWLPPVVISGCLAVSVSAPICGTGGAEIAVITGLQLAVSFLSLSGYALLCRRVFHRRWMTLFAPLSLLLIPLPLYALLYGIAAWSELPLLRLVGGDGVFAMLSWVCQLALFALAMIFSGNALLKKAPRFPQSTTISLLSGLASLVFGSIFFLYGALGALTDGNMALLQLMLPPGLLFVLPPLVLLTQAARGRLPEQGSAPRA